MQARDAAGRQVSLLNEEPTVSHNSHQPSPSHLPRLHPLQQLQYPHRPSEQHQQQLQQHQHPLSYEHQRSQQQLQQHLQQSRPSLYAASHILSRPYPTSRSNSFSPTTPELLRSHSYDSQLSNDPASPLTPSVDYSYPPAAPLPLDASTLKRPLYSNSSRSTSFEDESSSPALALPLTEQRPGKRYPCHYRDTHRCDKTFTTSGHASRHSKIHTAEKAVHCTYPGCQKKFTRADNMKQHLETHHKEKRHSAAAAAAASATGRSSHKPLSADVRHRPSAASRASRSSPKSSSTTTTTSASLAANRNSLPSLADQLPLPMSTPPLLSPGGPAWDLRGLTTPR